MLLRGHPAAPNLALHLPTEATLTRQAPEQRGGSPLGPYGRLLLTEPFPACRVPSSTPVLAEVLAFDGTVPTDPLADPTDDVPTKLSRPMAAQGSAGPSPLLELPLPGRPRGSPTARTGTGISPSDQGVLALPSVFGSLLNGPVFWPLAARSNGEPLWVGPLDVQFPDQGVNLDKVLLPFSYLENVPSPDNPGTWVFGVRIHPLPSLEVSPPVQIPMEPRDAPVLSFFSG